MPPRTTSDALLALRLVRGTAFFAFLLSACATTDTADPYGGMQTSVVSRNAGYRFESDGRGEATVRISELDGANHDLAWKAVSEKDENALRSTQACLAEFMNRLRFDSRASSATPSLIGDEAMRCASTSGLPAPRDVVRPDATEYDVSISTHNAVDPPTPPGAIALNRSGASRLGASWRVSKPDVGRAAVASDANLCLLSGVKEVGAGWSSVSGPSQDGLVYGISSIQSLATWFADCMKKRGYEIEAHTPVNS